MKNNIINLNKLILCALIGISTSIFSNNWKQIEEKSRNSVVQIESKKAKFNWLEPYKAPEVAGNIGSGFIIDTEGHILTNYHVIEDSKYISILLPSLGKVSLSANVIGIYPEIDIALIKLDKYSLDLIKKEFGSVSYLNLGDSDELYSTNSVMALGYPFGKRYLKSTIGEVAGKDYTDESSFTHITAPLNPGNSGGPLLNMKGEVLGINSAILTGKQNVCYCIDINDVKIVLSELKTEKVIRKPRLGINYNALTEEHRKILGSDVEGIYVNTVSLGSVAAESGIQVGDILTSINGYKIDRFGDVCISKEPFKMVIEEYLMKLPINQIINIELFRSGKIINLKVNYSYKPTHLEKVYTEFDNVSLDYEIFGGMCVMQTTKNHLDELGSPNFENYQSLIITNILPGSVIANTKCINTGMVLNSINDIPVHTLADLRSAVSQSKDIMTLKANSNIVTAVSLNKIKQEEPKLSKDFGFQISNLIK